MHFSRNNSKNSLLTKIQTAGPNYYSTLRDRPAGTPQQQCSNIQIELESNKQQKDFVNKFYNNLYQRGFQKVDEKQQENTKKNKSKKNKKQNSLPGKSDSEDSKEENKKMRQTTAQIMNRQIGYENTLQTYSHNLEYPLFSLS